MTPTVLRLESGYWHVRWTDEVWAQWPCHRQPLPGDFFNATWTASGERITEAVLRTAVVESAARELNWDVEP